MSQRPAMQPQKQPRRRGGVFRFFRNIAFLLLIFTVGINVGNGNFLSITSTQVTSNNSLPANLDYEEVERMYDVLRANYDGKLDVEKLIDGMKSGLATASGDPYTEYLSAADAKAFNDQMSGTFSGIGAELDKDDDDNLIIVAPVSGFPADKAGLRPKDIILTINGESTRDVSINEAVTKIRGEAGTSVKLGILRDKSEQLEFNITRANITIPSVEYEILEGNIGYIQISQFWTDTAGLTEKAAQEFKQKGVQEVIVDLRGNPGGTLDSSVEVASLWLPNGKTVLEERRDGKVKQVFRATGAPLLRDMPTVVLINEGSASASEILAGALKDNNAATLIGQQSYGKGSVQQIIPLPDGSELKVTIARWHRPNGENIDKKGIKPDQAVEISDADYEADHDPQLDAAKKHLQTEN